MKSIDTDFSNSHDYRRSSWLTLELILLSLMIISLPSLEAPKNIFLIFYVAVSSLRQIKSKAMRSWGTWDWMFLTILGSALLSTIYAGMPGNGEWKGFRVLVTMISTGWLISRSNYSKKEIAWLFGLTVLSTIPPLLFGHWQYLYAHTKPDLRLHSVGHVNHSAIYLTMIYGAALGWLISCRDSVNKSKKFLLSILTIVLFISLIIGQSRGAFGVGFILTISLILILGKNLKLKLLMLSFLASISILAVMLNAGIVQKELNNEKNHYVLSDRDRVWNVSLEAARFSPIFGIGMSNWGYIKLQDLKESVEKRHEEFNPNKYLLQVGHSHNVYLTALVDRGFVGLIVTLLFMFYWLGQLIKTFYITKISNQATYLWAGSFSAWLTTFGVGFVNTTFHHEHGILACLFLGFYLTYCRLYDSEKII